MPHNVKRSVQLSHLRLSWAFTQERSQIASAKIHNSIILTLCTQVGVHTVEGLINLIARERQGEQVDRTRLKSLLRMFNNMVSFVWVEGW